MIRLTLLILLVLGIVGAVWVWMRVAKVQRDSRYAMFQANSAPSPLPDGFWPGTWAGGGTDWLGKEFDAATQTGLNVFQATPEPAKRIPFRMSVALSLKNEKQTVLLLDYNVEGNSPWIRLVRDEVVQVAPGKLLGLLYYKLGPIVIPVDFFEQQQGPTIEQ
ncbi:MAG: hypothetical protein AAB701_01675 [Patescibacteria group bacterium]